VEKPLIKFIAYIAACPMILFSAFGIIGPPLINASSYILMFLGAFVICSGIVGAGFCLVRAFKLFMEETDV
jgi:hypothetical protein